MKITGECATQIPDLVTNHEEADTKIAYLIQHAMSAYQNIEIIVRSCSGDVDIPVILTGLFGSSTTHISLDYGTEKHRNNIRIDSSALSDIQCKAMVGYNALSGKDYVSSFL